SDLYNWKAQNPKFSEKPAGLIDLLDSVLFTHQPTWDDCRQLLQVLFTTEERERILNEARKLVPGADGNPTTNQAQIEASFPLTRPQWDFNTAEEGARGHLAAPPCHLRGWPDPDTSSVQAGRLGLRQEAPPRDSRAALEGTLHCGVDNPHRSQGRRHRDLGPSHPRSASGPLLDPEGLRHAMGHQLGPTQPAQAQATAHSTYLILVTLLTLLVIAHAAGSPHAPQNITWQIIDTSSGTILNQTSQSHPRDTWFPELCVNLQTLFSLSP
uniref:Core shell protein Gag P30 domain-containing protein n=1 Tax=Felis catus TaxID=9685 RepID=A0ABI7Z9C2_FELCA